MFNPNELERLYEVMAEAKEAIILAKTALQKKTIDERQIEASFEDVPVFESNIIHIMPKTFVDFNSVQSKNLKLVPDVTDLLSKLCEDLCFVVVLNRQHLKNKSVRKHIEEMLTITIMVTKILQEEVGRTVAGGSSKMPGDQGPTVA